MSVERIEWEAPGANDCGFSINKKLKRAIRYHDDGTVALYDNVEGQDPIIFHASRDEGHRWLHGKERHDDAPGMAPSFDDMESAIAARLKDEMTEYMTWALDNPDAMQAMYSAVKSNRKLTRAYW